MLPKFGYWIFSMGIKLIKFLTKKPPILCEAAEPYIELRNSHYLYGESLMLMESLVKARVTQPYVNEFLMGSHLRLGKASLVLKLPHETLAMIVHAFEQDQSFRERAHWKEVQKFIDSPYVQPIHFLDAYRYRGRSVRHEYGNDYCSAGEIDDIEEKMVNGTIRVMFTVVYHDLEYAPPDVLDEQEIKSRIVKDYDDDTDSDSE
jgi:hypothetical protein